MTTIDGSNALLIVGRRQRSARKLALLNTAIALFAERGYHAVTIRDIGDEMGMTSASLYRHYESKEALLADAVDLVIHPMIEAIEDIRSTDDSPRLRLRAAVEFHATFAREHRTYLRVYYTEGRQLGPEHRTNHRRNSGRYRDAWVDLLLSASAAADEREAGNLYLMTMAMLNLGTTGERTSLNEWLPWVSARTMNMLVGPED
jgi:AcrR family transcriptional regulator